MDETHFHHAESTKIHGRDDHDSTHKNHPVKSAEICKVTPGDDHTSDEATPIVPELNAIIPGNVAIGMEKIPGVDGKIAT